MICKNFDAITGRPSESQYTNRSKKEEVSEEDIDDDDDYCEERHRKSKILEKDMDVDFDMVDVNDEDGAIRVLTWMQNMAAPTIGNALGQTAAPSGSFIENNNTARPECSIHITIIPETSRVSYAPGSLAAIRGNAQGIASKGVRFEIGNDGKTQIVDRWGKEIPRTSCLQYPKAKGLIVKKTDSPVRPKIAEKEGIKQMVGHYMKKKNSMSSFTSEVLHTDLVPVMIENIRSVSVFNNNYSTDAIRPTEALGKYVTDVLDSIGPTFFQLIRRNYKNVPSLSLFRLFKESATRLGRPFLLKLELYASKLYSRRDSKYLYYVFNEEGLSYEGKQGVATLLCNSEYVLSPVSDEEIHEDMVPPATLPEYLRASNAAVTRLIDYLEKNGFKNEIESSESRENSAIYGMETRVYQQIHPTVRGIFLKYFCPVRKFMQGSKDTKKYFMINKVSEMEGMTELLDWLRK